MIKFTIATCTWNAAAQLPPTLASIREQDYPCIEHLIIDGASSDDSLQLLHDYEVQAPANVKVRIVSEPDHGLYDAMNKALRLAEGDYILFLNAGDRLHSPQTLSLVAQAAEKVSQTGSCGVLYGDTDIVDAAGHFIRHRRLVPPEHLNWRSFRQGMLVCHQAFMASVPLARECPYNLHYRFSADFDWCIRIMQMSGQRHMPLCNTHQVIADYLEGGMTTKNHRASLRERFDVMRRHYGLCQTVALHLWFCLRAVIHR